MRKITAFSLSCLSLLVVACADSPDKYRDIKHLEMPPTLAIERNTSAPVKSSRSSTASTSTGSESKSKSASDLDKLIYITGDDQHPVLQLKTRFERGWDLINHGLQLADIEVIDKNHDDGKIRVRYVADQNTKGRGFVGSVTSFFTDKFADTEYTLTLDKDSKLTGVHIDKVTSADDADSFNNNDAKALADLLQTTIKTDLAK